MASHTLSDYFPKLCKPRKRHRCRLCWQIIEINEPCCRWSGIEPGEGYRTEHAHPECYQDTLDQNWDEMDWECCMPGDLERPTIKATHPDQQNHDKYTTPSVPQRRQRNP